LITINTQERLVSKERFDFNNLENHFLSFQKKKRIDKKKFSDHYDRHLKKIAEIVDIC